MVHKLSKNKKLFLIFGSLILIFWIAGFIHSRNVEELKNKRKLELQIKQDSIATVQAKITADLKAKQDSIDAMEKLKKLAIEKKIKRAPKTYLAFLPGTYYKEVRTGLGMELYTLKLGYNNRFSFSGPLGTDYGQWKKADTDKDGTVHFSLYGNGIMIGKGYAIADKNSQRIDIIYGRLGWITNFQKEY